MVRCCYFGTAFFAGALSLVSQIATLRLAASQLSASSLTIALVLLSALGGLSVGSLVIGRVSDRNGAHRKLAFISLALAAAISILIAWIGDIALTWLRSQEMPLAAEVGCFVFVSIFPVNVLLGGIIPALTRAVTSTPKSKLYQSFSAIYALETVGAAVGSVLLTFTAIPFLGLKLSWMLAGVVALLWAMAALIFVRKEFAAVLETELAEQLVDGAGSVEKTPVDLNGNASLRYLLLVAALVCSCASLGMELIWQRYFVIVFGSDTHSYAIVATVFLAGISIGAAVASPVIRCFGASVKLYSNLILMFGALILGSVLVLKIGFRVESVRTLLGWLDSQPLVARLAAASSVLLLPTILIGIALPVLVSLWVGDRKTIGTNSGQLYGVVILGNILGIVLCAVWLIPAFGLQITAVILGVMCQIAGVLVFLVFGRAVQRSSGTRSILNRLWCVAVCFVGLGLAGYLMSSKFYPGIDQGVFKIIEHYEEAASHTVAVVQPEQDSLNKHLLIDGVTIGEMGQGVDEKQQMLAHLPFLIGDVERAKVLTIGLGTGILAGELTKNEQVESVTCVELSAAIIRAAEFFAGANHNVLANEKLDLRHGDGVRFLRSVNANANAETKFDVIVSDGKSRPGSAANIPFFSREYYELCARSLSDEGVFCQWVSIRCDREELESILVTFAGAFPFGHIAVASPDSVYLVGGRSPIQFSGERMNKHLAAGSTVALRSYDWVDADDFLAMYWIDQSVVGKTFGDAAVNTFDRPVLELFAWESFDYSVSQTVPQLDVVAELLGNDRDSLLNGMPLEKVGDAELQTEIQSGRSALRRLLESDRIILAAEEGWLDQAADEYKGALEHLPNLNRGAKIAGYYRELVAEAREEQVLNKEFSSLINLAEIGHARPDDELRMAQILELNNAHDRALDHYYRAVSLADGKLVYRLAFGEGCMRATKYSQAIRQLNTVIKGATEQVDSQQTLFRAKLLKGISLIKLGRTEEGQELVFGVLDEHPELEGLYREHVN